MIGQYVKKCFGVGERMFLEALKSSPSAQGYIMGAISEASLKKYLERGGYETVRIKEKPSGGNNAKEVRGDFYIRKKGSRQDKWLVIESKGLKSNSEFRGDKFDSPEKVFRFLNSRVFGTSRSKSDIYNKGHREYLKQKKGWEKQNSGKTFPKFAWDTRFPGPESYDLKNIWKNVDDLREWVFSLPKKCFTEKEYRKARGAVAVLETHQPSKRRGEKTGIEQASPLVSDFDIMSVDLFLRTGKHEFVFMNSKNISHSPTSPEHLYQNYTIDILIPNKKETPTIQSPWYDDIAACIRKTKPPYRKINRSQVDNR